MTMCSVNQLFEALRAQDLYDWAEQHGELYGIGIEIRQILDAWARHLREVCLGRVHHTQRFRCGPIGNLKTAREPLARRFVEEVTEIRNRNEN